MKLRTVMSALSLGLLLSFTGIMTSCASGDKDKDNGDEMASDAPVKKKHKKKHKKKAKASEDAGAGGDAP